MRCARQYPQVLGRVATDKSPLILVTKGEDVCLVLTVSQFYKDFKIIEREEPKCVKLEATTSPIPLTLWIQMLPTSDETSKMKLTLRTELNPFIKGMVQKPLQEGIEKMAEMLAQISY